MNTSPVVLHASPASSITARGCHFVQWSSRNHALQVLPDSGSWRTERASVDAWVLDPNGQKVWRRADTRGGDPFSFAVQGARVRQPEHCHQLRFM